MLEQAVARPRLFYGRVVVSAAFVSLSVASSVIYAFPALFDQLQHEFQASRAEVSFAFSACTLILFLMGVISGPLTDKLGPRTVIFSGALIMALGLAVAGYANSLSVLYPAYGIGVGVGGVSFMFPQSAPFKSGSSGNGDSPPDSRYLASE